MTDFPQLLPSLGGLHDARLLRIAWYGDTQRLEIRLDDLYANFEGLPEYKGPKEAVIVFDGVRRLDIQIDLGEVGLLVYDCMVTSKADAVYTTDVLFSPGGRISIDSTAPYVRS